MNVNAFKGNAGDPRKRGAKIRGALRRRPKFEAIAGLVVLGRTGLRLHRIGGDTLRTHICANDMGSPAEGLVGSLLVAVLVFKCEVAGHVVMQRLRTVGDRVTGLDVAGHILVFDLDQFGGVLCDVDGIGDHQRHRLADEAHALVGQAGAKRHVE